MQNACHYFRRRNAISGLGLICDDATEQDAMLHADNFPPREGVLPREFTYTATAEASVSFHLGNLRARFDVPRHAMLPPVIRQPRDKRGSGTSSGSQAIVSAYLEGVPSYRPASLRMVM